MRQLMAAVSWRRSRQRSMPSSSRLTGAIWMPLNRGGAGSAAKADTAGGAGQAFRKGRGGRGGYGAGVAPGGGARGAKGGSGGERGNPFREGGAGGRVFGALGPTLSKTPGG